MEIVTDYHTDKSFCVDKSRAHQIICSGIDEYSIIDWCQQFTHPTKNFIDIGSGFGQFTVVLAPNCKQVFAFESCNFNYDCLVMNIFLNSLENVITHNNNIEDAAMSDSQFMVDNVSLLKYSCDGREYEAIIGSSKILEKNNFPPFIFKTNKLDSDKKSRLIEFITTLGYKVHTLSGNNFGYMLASDHNSGDQSDAILNWEDYFNLSKAYRLEGLYKKACKYAKKSLREHIPKEKEYLPLQELAISSYYIGKISKGYDYCEKIIFSHHVPWNVRNLTISNQSFYINALKIKSKKVIECDMPANYLPSSASIVASGDHFRINLRAVNYYLGENGSGISTDADNKLRSRNYLLTYDINLNKINNIELKDISGVDLYPRNVLGMDDIRLFGDKYFFCTYSSLNNDQIPQTGWGTYDSSTGDVTRMVPLKLTSELKCEKNWLPFINNNGDINIIYSINPFKLLRLDIKSGKISEVKTIELSEYNINDFRGSACPVKYKNGWLLTIHQVHFAEPRKYFHRFMYFDNDFTSMKFSKAFYFETPCIEFNLSICHSPNGLLLAYSRNDRESYLVTIDYNVIDDMLQIC
jgi:hypothetical protein